MTHSVAGVRLSPGASVKLNLVRKSEDNRGYLTTCGYLLPFNTLKHNHTNIT